MKNSHFICTLLFCSCISAIPFDSLAVSFLPDKPYFTPTILDPATCQLNGSMVAARSENGFENRAYSMVNLGASKIILRWENPKLNGVEIGTEFAIHSMFNISDVGSNYLGGLQNTDYRIAGIAHFKHGHFVHRLSLFHQSSHLGDDYIIRNEKYEQTSRVLNYEQLDYTLSKQAAGLRSYGLIGYNISPNTVRDRFMVQGGYWYSKPLWQNSTVKVVQGLDIKIYEQNSFRPNLKLGLGIQMGINAQNPVYILFEYYNGHMPYSVLEYKIVEFIGLGIYIPTSI